MLNRRLGPIGRLKLGKNRGLTVTGPGLHRQEAAGRVLGRLWNGTEPFLQSNPGPLAGYPDPLIPLWLGDGHNFHNGSGAHKEVFAEVDEA